MSKGKSKVGNTTGSGSGNQQQNTQNQPANTPSGVSYSQFMSMTEDERFDAMDKIIHDRSIVVPNYLDGSVTTKVLYALGMNNKPTVVTDAQLDSMQGREIFRTVYEQGSMPPPSSDAILDQIRNGDYTQMSGSGGSAHGRALYFATNYGDSAVYGHGERNAMMMRAKLNPGAKIVRESNLYNQMTAKPGFQSKFSRVDHRDQQALFAISQGIDGWYSSSYTMIVNRGALTASSQNKTIRSGRGYASSWATANNAK